MPPIRFLAPLLLLLFGVLAACGADVEVTFSAETRETLYIGGIPDQDASVLQARFERLAEYLSEETDLDVRYVPSVDYAAVVTSFRHGDLHMAWYGGLTGVQARLAVPESHALVQRPEDEEFRSVFVVQKELGITSLADLKEMTFTFGSESSTSGHLMPRHFLSEAGVDPEADFSAVNYSGSHDKTWKLVETGAFQAGALNALVWQARVEAGDVDLSRVEVLELTPPYYDYHWVARGDVDTNFGDGTIDTITEALLKLDASNGGRDQEIMEAFQTQNFIATRNENYQAIEEVARGLDIIRE